MAVRLSVLGTFGLLVLVTFTAASPFGSFLSKISKKGKLASPYEYLFVIASANGPSMNERFRDKDGFRFAHVYQMEFGTDIRFYYNGFVFRSPKDKLDKLVKTAKTDLPARYRHLENSPLANYYIHTKLLDVREDLVPDLHYMIDHAEELWDRGNQHINYTVFSKTLPKSKQHGPLTWDQLPKQVFDGLLEPDSFPKTSLSKGAKEAPW